MAQWPMNDCFYAEMAAHKAAARNSVPRGHEWYVTANFNQFQNTVAAAVANLENKENQVQKEMTELIKVLLSKKQTTVAIAV